MSAFDPLYQTEKIKELASEISDAFVNGNEFAMRWRIDMLQEHLDHIKDYLERDQ